MSTVTCFRGGFEFHENIIFFSFYPRGDRVGSYVKAIGSQMKTKEELDEVSIRLENFISINQDVYQNDSFFQVQSFINKSSGFLKGTELTVSQTIETVKINTAWTSKFYHKIINHMI